MDTLKTATLLLAAGVEAAAALVIGLAAIEATVRALLLFVPHPAAWTSRMPRSWCGHPAASRPVRRRFLWRAGRAMGSRR